MATQYPPLQPAATRPVTDKATLKPWATDGTRLIHAASDTADGWRCTVARWHGPLAPAEVVGDCTATRREVAIEGAYALARGLHVAQGADLEEES